MSILADVQDLYGGVRSTWTKSHAHVVAHVVLALVLFVLFRVPIPEIHLPKVSAAQIANNEWFKLAKDTGVIYVSFVIPFVLVAVYGALLRTVGQWLIGALALLFPPDPDRNRFRLLNEWTIEPLALIVKKEEFEISDLVAKASEVAVKYQSKKNAQWENYTTSLGGLTKNSTIYLGDFLFFLAGWITIFHAFPHVAWVQTNESRFWPVALVLLGLAWFASFRVSRALMLMPSLHLAFVSTMVRTDPDMASLLESSEEHRNSVRLRLQNLLSDEQKRADGKPSLRRLIYGRFGYSKKANGGLDAKTLLGWPFCSLYQRGYQVSYAESDGQHESAEIESYLAYLYYKSWERAWIVAKAVLSLARYALTGTP